MADQSHMELKKATKEQIYQISIVALVAFVVIAIYYHREKLLPGYHGEADPSLANPAPLSLARGMYGVPAKERAVGKPTGRNMFPIINKPFSNFIGNPISEGYMCPQFNNLYAWPHTWIG